MNNCLNCGDHLPPNTVIYLSEPQTPFCQDCTDANRCKEEIDAKCVVYHSDNVTPSKLTALNMPNLSSAEAIFEAIDDLIQNGANVPVVPLTSTTVLLTVSGPANHKIKAEVIDDSITFSKLQNITPGLFGRSTAGSGDPSLITIGDGLELSSQTLSTALTLDSGTYTPTLTNETNITSSTAYPCQYLRVGETVTVSGRVRFTATTTLTVTQLGISLPIASNFALEGDAAGVAADNKGVGYAVRADVTSNRAQLYAVPVLTDSEFYWFTFTYQLI